MKISSMSIFIRTGCCKKLRRCIYSIKKPYPDFKTLLEKPQLELPNGLRFELEL